MIDSSNEARPRPARHGSCVNVLPVLFLAAMLGALVGGSAMVARAQVPPGPGIPELQRLVEEREVEIGRLEVRLAALERRADSLSQAKRRAEPGSADFEQISNQILDSSRDITEIARRLRILYEQVRDLKTDLFIAYNTAISETRQQSRALTERGRTTENSREMRRLVGHLEEYVRARERLAGEIEEAQDDLFLPELVYDPRDGPAQLRVKEAIARDAIDRIDERIAATENQITKALQRKRDLEEFRRLQQDLDMWGDDEAARGGSVIETILQDRAVGAGPSELFEDPDVRIRELQRRRLELIDRRADYEAKARLFAERQREFNP